MNSSQLSKILSCLPNFRGVFAADTVPVVPRDYSNWSLVVNTAPIASGGDHWVAMWFENEILHFFCSYGSHPVIDLSANIRRCIGNRFVLYNPNQIQGECSSVCGHYCVVFLISMCLGLSYASFLELFTRGDLSKNDAWVKHIVDRVGNVEYDSRDREWVRDREKMCRVRQYKSALLESESASL